ncbi:Hypothetical predicted protein [Paramuricea clavata]|uniref:Uncharacterized protein n=1 Tax=Paramuricea clavata TaxID=317549 RepID=A0A7D9DQK6_PARCT|nr:Hypothetical predicted protein [Paramuricea clavata]
MVRHGLSDLSLIDQNKEKAVQDIVAEVLTTRTAALDAIFTGMNTCDLGTLMRSNPSVTSIVFPSPEDVEDDVKLMKARFKGIDSFDFDTNEKRNPVQWFLDFLEEADKESGMGPYTKYVTLVFRFVIPQSPCDNL